MTSQDEETRSRIGAESRTIINSARTSNAISDEHVRQSRDVIARSFRLLASPFAKARGGGVIDGSLFPPSK